MTLDSIKLAWKYGWPVGLLLFIFVELVPAFKTHELHLYNLVVGVIIWSFGALWFGFVFCRIKGIGPPQ